MITFLTQHQFGFAVAGYWGFSAAVSSMPEPKAGDAGGYAWLYRFVHTIAGNLTTAFPEAARYRAGASRRDRLPVSKILSLVLLVLLIFPTAACAARIAVHPGALNVADSAAYDTLIIASSMIDQARTEQIPPGVKAALNRLVQSYNVARASYLTYHDALAANAPSDAYFQQLTKNLTDLTNAIQAVRDSDEKGGAK